MKKKAKKKPIKKIKKKSVPKKLKKAVKKIVKKVTRAKTKPTVIKKKPKIVSPTLAYIPAENEVSLGVVEDYFGHIGVLALTIKENLNLGDTIHVRGHTTDLTKKVDSMQMNHAAVQNAKKGDSIGIKVTDKCRKGDKVFRVG